MKTGILKGFYYVKLYPCPILAFSVLYIVTHVATRGVVSVAKSKVTLI